MTSLEIKLDMSQLEDILYKIPEKAKDVAASVLTSAAFDTNAAIKDAMSSTFAGGATPYALRAFRVTKATKSSLKSTVALRTDSPGKGNPYNVALEHLFTGGNRAWKKMEGAFLKTGYLPPGFSMVPGSGCPLDSYGNASPGFIRQLLSYLGAAEINAGYRANMTEKRKAKLADVGRTESGYKTINGVVYFISRGKGNWFGARSWKNGMTQHLPMGIWRKSGIHGIKVEPVFLFVRRAHYKKVIDIENVLNQYLSNKFNVMVGRYAAKLLKR